VHFGPRARYSGPAAADRPNTACGSAALRARTALATSRRLPFPPRPTAKVGACMAARLECSWAMHLKSSPGPFPPLRQAHLTSTNSSSSKPLLLAVAWKTPPPLARYAKQDSRGAVATTALIPYRRLHPHLMRPWSTHQEILDQRPTARSGLYYLRPASTTYLVCSTALPFALPPLSHLRIGVVLASPRYTLRACLLGSAHRDTAS
jgi:hypothetical protein